MRDFVEYTNKRWLEKPISLPKLLQQLKFRLIGEVKSKTKECDYLVQRYGEKRPIFHLFHISVGNFGEIQKYKLLRIDVFGYSR